jgi:mRNA interferase YafQ
MKSFRLAARYSRDYKRVAKRGYDLDKLDVVLDLLAAAEALPPARRDHPLKGEWKDHRECHIEPDWLLIYRTTDDEVMLARTGTHADLFGT